MFKSSLAILMRVVLWVVTGLAMLEVSDEAMSRHAFWPLQGEGSVVLAVIQR